MAPYAIAHLKIGLKLYESGYHFRNDECARIFLTNALEPASDTQMTMDFLPALAREAQAVNNVKCDQRFTVVIGNPPYANYSANLSPECRRIVDKYRNFHNTPIRERNQLQFERNIQDDFVKFVSTAQDIIGETGCGVLGYITNGTMLASSSLRGMRDSLMRQFSGVSELNLHGGHNELILGQENDENVFDIAQSVAIHLYVRSKHGGSSVVNYADLLGRRTSKYASLVSGSIADTEWQEIHPDQENCSFVSQDEAEDIAICRLDSLFVQYGAGIKTNRDAVVIGFDDASLLQTIRDYDATLVEGDESQTCIQSLLYRPFDIRRVFYHVNAVASRSLPTMKHVNSGSNIGLVACSTWTTPDRFSVGISRVMVEMKAGTHDRGTTFFPLYRYDSLVGGRKEQVPNLTPEFIEEWCARTKTTFVPIGRGDGKTQTGPEDVLFWLFGLFHSPAYRRRYRSALSRGFPRVLVTSNLELLGELVRLGGELVALHILESAKLDNSSTTYTGPRNPVVGRIGWSVGTIWLDAGRTIARGGQRAIKSGTIGFKGVPEEVWDFHIGGYQVCHKWLKDRRGRALSDDDMAHYQKIVTALEETIRIMAEIDDIIEAHGGWPAAFEADKAKSATAEIVPFRPRIVETEPADRYVTCAPLIPLQAAAGAFGDPQTIDETDDFEWAAIDTSHRLRPGMFVAQIVGKSMEPAIPDGTWCLFRAPVEGTREGKTVLVQLRDAIDRETGQRYTVKRYASEKVQADGSWRHTRITLKPNNPVFEPIVLTGEDEGDLQVVAELIEVLGENHG